MIEGVDRYFVAIARKIFVPLHYIQCNAQSDPDYAYLLLLLLLLLLQVVAMKEEIKTYLTGKGVQWEEVSSADLCFRCLPILS
jgi:hypothetical protein